jgi:hypothetical protein
MTLPDYRTGTCPHCDEPREFGAPLCGPCRKLAGNDENGWQRWTVPIIEPESAATKADA